MNSFQSVSFLPPTPKLSNDGLFCILSVLIRPNFISWARLAWGCTRQLFCSVCAKRSLKTCLLVPGSYYLPSPRNRKLSFYVKPCPRSMWETRHIKEKKKSLNRHPWKRPIFKKALLDTNHLALGNRRLSCEKKTVSWGILRVDIF